MCGITGFVSIEKNKKKIIKKMADRIAHRGPDDEGFYVDDNVALGHRRLSIIDLSTGNQPMFNEDKSKVIIFNGEIYNYQELKLILLDKGHVFRTTSDTEVLIHGYEEWGIDLPKKLRGMFSFVIWDIKQQILFGARDHFGIKPMYYYHQDNVLMFASEIKAFLEHPKFKKELNKDLLGSYLVFNYVPGNDTFFKNVYRLNPGHYFLYKDNNLKVEKYFELKFENIEKEYEEYVEDIAKTMEDSVRAHQISDVEVGSFLSSGIDSSYIVSLANPDKTYTVGYDIPKYNEIDYAKDLADKLNINNTSKKINMKEYINIIPKIMYHMDEPLADPAAVALYFVSELASKDVKVVLSGEGADELFGGYKMYREEVRFAAYNKVPFGIRKIISNFFKLLPEFKGSNFFVRRGQTLEESFIGINWNFREREINKFLKEKNKIPMSSYTLPIFKSQKGQPNINKMQAIDINLWLNRDILLKADRMTMANSIEGRVPFTDIEVWNTAKTLNFEAKLSKEQTKVALRDAAKKVIPNESYKKKKLGFPVPLREWMREEIVYNKILNSFQTPIADELFQSKRIIKLLNDHKDGKRDNYKKVWAIYCFIVWYQEFFEANF